MVAVKIPWKCPFLPWSGVQIKALRRMTNRSIATERTCTTRDSSKTHSHRILWLHTLHNRERKQICLCLLTSSHPKNGSSLWQTHRFLILLFRAPGFLGFLNDGIEREAQAAHARQVGHVYVELQLLIPQWLRAHGHLRGGHHLTEELAAVEQTGLHHQLEGKHTHTHTQWRLEEFVW